MRLPVPSRRQLLLVGVCLSCLITAGAAREYRQQFQPVSDQTLGQAIQQAQPDLFAPPPPPQLGTTIQRSVLRPQLPNTAPPISQGTGAGQGPPANQSLPGFNPNLGGQRPGPGGRRGGQRPRGGIDNRNGGAGNNQGTLGGQNFQQPNTGRVTPSIPNNGAQQPGSYYQGQPDGFVPPASRGTLPPIGTDDEVNSFNAGQAPATEYSSQPQTIGDPSSSIPPVGVNPPPVNGGSFSEPLQNFDQTIPNRPGSPGLFRQEPNFQQRQLPGQFPSQLPASPASPIIGASPVQGQMIPGAVPFGASRNGPIVGQSLPNQPFGAQPFGHGNIFRPALPCGCQPRLMTRTVYVPQWQTVLRPYTEWCTRMEPRTGSYTTYETIYKQVPQTVNYNVVETEVKEKQYTNFRYEEYRVNVIKNYAEMVVERKKREVPTVRQETYEVPKEEQYTVMVPREKEEQYTVFETVQDKIPVQKFETVQVPQQRTRLVTTYEEQSIPVTVREKYVEQVPKVIEKDVVEYKIENRTLTYEVPFFRYRVQDNAQKVAQYSSVTKTRPITETYKELVDVPRTRTIVENYQTPEIDTREEQYTVPEPYTVMKDESYFVSVPYKETVEKPYMVAVQEPREIIKRYTVQVPYEEEVPQTYMVNVPVLEPRTTTRTVYDQVPETRYRAIRRDVGSWRTIEKHIPVCECLEDECGCPHAVAGCRTICQRVWVPKIETYHEPYIVFQRQPKQIPHTVLATTVRREARQRMVTVKRMKTEQRETSDFVMDTREERLTKSYEVTKFRTETRTRKVPVQKLRLATKTRRTPLRTYRRDKKTVTIPYTVSELQDRTRTIQEDYSDIQTTLVDDPLPFKVAVEDKRTESVTYQVRVADFRKVRETVLVPQIKYRAKRVVQKRMVPKIKEVPYTIMVPEVRVREEFETVARKVPVIKTRMVTVMEPEIRTRSTTEFETKQVPGFTDVEYSVMVPTVKQRNTTQIKYRKVPEVRTLTYQVPVVKQKSKTIMRTVAQRVPRQKTYQYFVKVPYPVQRQIPVHFCRMVPRTVVIPCEPCCPKCCSESFRDLNQVTSSYLGLASETLFYGADWLFDRR